MLAQILISIALTAVVLMQGKGGGLGSIFGGSGDIYKTRRGLEKTLLQVTIVLAGAFLLIALLTVSVS